MNPFHAKNTLIQTVCAVAAAWLLLGPALAAESTPDADRARAEADYEAMLEDAERARAQAETARREAEKAALQAREAARRHAETARLEAFETAQHAREEAHRESAQRDEGADRERHRALEERERQRAVTREEMERIQEELSRAHRELREATREIARAHRDIARNTELHRVVREINLGERAVIGVVLGTETEEGVRVIGVSPGGPADQAGLQTGDVILSIRGESLARGNGKAGRETLYEVMSETGPGETLAIVVDRDGESWTFDVTAEQREPSSWQTLIRIPEAPPAPATPGEAPALPATPAAPPVIVERIERIELPDIDEEALNERVRRLQQEFEHEKFIFVAPDGEAFEFGGDFDFTHSFDVEVSELSDLAERALGEANVWFGLSQTQGLELARMNDGLGAYFDTQRGVLVLEARETNAYQLRAGDVVLRINETEVDSPADLMRALRVIEPGSDVELLVKRDRRDVTMTVTMPENRLGHRASIHSHD